MRSGLWVWWWWCLAALPQGNERSPRSSAALHSAGAERCRRQGLGPGAAPGLGALRPGWGWLLPATQQLGSAPSSAAQMPSAAINSE